MTSPEPAGFSVSSSTPDELADFPQLLARAAQGDPEAQGELCRHYERQVRVVARVLLGPALRPHLDTVDILQSVHRSLLVGLRDEKFDISSPEKLVALASTMVRRKVARKWRRHRKQTRWDPTLPAGEPLADAFGELNSQETDPHDAAAFREKLQLLLESLNATDRRLLQMRLDGHAGAEIAAALQLHPVAMRVRWTRLRQRLEKSNIAADWL